MGDVAARFLTSPATVFLATERATKLAAHAGRHFDERFGHRRAFHRDGGAGAQGEHHEDRGEQLRRGGGVDGKSPEVARRMQGKREMCRWRSIGLRRAAAGARQGIKQAAHGAGPHGLIAVEFEATPRRKGEESGEEACGRAGVTDEKFRAPVRNFSRQTGQADYVGRLIGGHVKAQSPECGDEDSRVAAKERAGQHRRSIG